MLIDHFRWIGLLATLWCIYHTEFREKKVRKWVIYCNPASTQTIRQPKPNRAQQQHIWLGKRYFARWIHVGPKLNRHPLIKQHSANHEPTMRQPKLNSVPTITHHCAKYHPTVCQPCPSSNIVPTITKLCANHKPTQNQL